jgi:sugar phosphate isomerase/epimerase
MTSTLFSRRLFLAMSAVLPWVLRSAASGGNPTGANPAGGIPVGLELYSVREGLKKDLEGTVRAVAGMGYEAVEFYAPYFEWSEAKARQMRTLLDGLGVKCYSTHNDEEYFSAKNIARVRELNLILGCKYAVLAWADAKSGADGWEALADKLNLAAEQLEPAGLKVGYHNHQAEWAAVGGQAVNKQRPMDILARNTKASVMLQLDVGTCLEGGADPVAWIRANPGRIRSIHCKEWSRDPAVGYKTLFGEGVADWKGIFEAAESVGGVEYYLVEQEGSRFPELETARKCLEGFRAARRER